MAQVVAVGTGKLKVDGVQYALADDLRIMAATEKREPLVGLDGSVAIQVQFVSPWIEATLRDTPDIDVTKIFAQRNVTVVVELQNGSSYELSEAFYTGDSELDSKEGTVSAKWNAKTIRRVL